MDLASALDKINNIIRTKTLPADVDPRQFLHLTAFGNYFSFQFHYQYQTLYHNLSANNSQHAVCVARKTIFIWIAQGFLGDFDLNLLQIEF